jgi:uncharacterized protein
LAATFTPAHAAFAFAATFVAGAINSVAGGGTLLSFPALIWLGLDSVTANATNTLAIWPGTVGSAWGYRRELRQAEPRFLILIAPSLLGGLTGALLLASTPSSTFDRLVPYLILFATLLFVVQEPVQRALKTEKRHESRVWFAGAMFFQLLVGLYGGYFGAGIGILMLAALSIMGMRDIYQMNGLKNILGGSVNGIAAVYFVCAGMVDWRYVGVGAVGSILGGYLAAGAARKVGRTAVRIAVIVIGFGMAVSLYFR